MKSLVSVLIPTYNHDAKLQRAIQSVLNQSVQDFEIIVVDNHSTDNTDAVVHAFNDSRIQLHKIDNKGVIAASRNLGLKYALGKYIALLDSDDWWQPNKLELSILALEKGYDLVYHDLWRVSDEFSKSFDKKVGAWKVDSPVYNYLLINGNAIPNSSVVFKSDIIRKVGLIAEEPELKGVEDFDFWLRISMFTEKFYFLPEVLGFYWYGVGNFSSNPKQLLIGLQKLESLHYQAYLTSHNNSLPYYIAFNIAKAAYRSGNYNLSKKYLRNLTNQKLSLKNLIKVRLVMFHLNLLTTKRRLSKFGNKNYN